MAVIRERTQVFNQPVGVRRVASGEQELWQTISQNAGKIADITFAEASKQAEQRGIDTALGVQTERLTTINPESGKPEAFAAPEGFGSIATDAYQRVVNKRYESSMLQELQIKSSEMASKYEYDPSGYDRSMSQYIAAMSENAEGRYKQLIVENGEARLASEMINIKNRVRVRARANAAASISAGVDRGANDAYDLGAAGNFEGIAAIVAEQGANAQDGIDAGLLRQGASDAAIEQIVREGATGAIEFAHTLATTSIERNAIDLYVRTNGNIKSGLSDELQSTLEPLLGLVTRDNREQILSHSATVSSDYDQVERDNNAIESAAVAKQIEEAASQRLSAATSGINVAFSLAENEADRNNIGLYLKTGGASGIKLSDEQKAALDSTLESVTPENRASVLARAESLTTSYNRVQDDETAAAKAIRDQEKLVAQALADRTEKEYIVDYGSDNADIIGGSHSVTALLLSEDSVMTLETAFFTADRAYGNLLVRSQGRFMDGTFSESEMKSQNQNDRRAIIAPIVIAATVDGNLSEFKAALASGNPADMENLSDNQIEIISSLYQSRMFVPTEDTAYVQGLVASTVNEASIQRGRVVAQMKAVDEIKAIGQSFTFSSVTQDAIAAANQKIDDMVIDGVFTTTEATKQRAFLGRSAAFGSLHVFSNGASAASLNRLDRYIETNGEVTEGMSRSEVLTGSYMLNVTEPSDVAAMSSKIGGLRAAASLVEEDVRKQQELAQSIARIGRGEGNMSDVSDRRSADVYFKNKEINLTDFNLYEPEAQEAIMRVLQSTFPQTGIDALNAIASGQEVKDADTWLGLFSALADDVTSTGISINRLGPALGGAGSKTVLFLKDVIAIQQNLGLKPEQSVSEISMGLIAGRNNPAAKITAKNTLGDLTPQDFAYEEVQDVLLASELASAVEYLSLTGKSADQINAAINEIVDSHYPEVKFIADPAMPMGSLNRSTSALENVYPDPLVREEFIKIVESEMAPLGYSLFADSSSTQLDMAAAYEQQRQTVPDPDSVALVTSRSQLTQMYLVPNRNVAGTAYYAYYVDKFGDLVPVMHSENGADYIPQFDQSEVADFRISLEAARADEKVISDAAVELELARQERAIEKLGNISALDLSVIP